MHIFEINILIFYFFTFDAFYMFRTQGFIFRKTVVYAVMVWYVLHARLLIPMHVKLSIP